MPQEIPGIPKHWQYFIVCLIFHSMLPLLPIGLELFQNKIVTDQSLSLVASMYAISIGTSSRNQLTFGLSIVICIVFAFVFGLASTNAPSTTNTGIYAFISIIFIFLINAAERYNRHAVSKQPYWEFSK